jgi:hypothetical protein
MKDQQQWVQHVLAEILGQMSFIANDPETEKCYAAGDKGAIFVALLGSCFARTPIPQWAQEALIKATLARPTSWDDIFGPLFEKGKQSGAFWDRMAMIAPVVANIELLATQGRSLEPDLFEQVGDQLGISERTASRIYYRAAPVMRNLLERLQKDLVARVGEEKAAENIAKAFEFFSTLEPGAANSYFFRIREILDNGGDLSELLSGVTKTP